MVTKEKTQINQSFAQQSPKSMAAKGVYKSNSCLKDVDMILSVTINNLLKNHYKRKVELYTKVKPFFFPEKYGRYRFFIPRSKYFQTDKILI